MSRAEYLQAIAADLKRQRQALGLSQDDVALGVGVAGASVSGWESGKRMPSAYSRDRLKAFFKQQWIERQTLAAREVAAAGGEVAQR